MGRGTLGRSGKSVLFLGFFLTCSLRYSSVPLDVWESCDRVVKNCCVFVPALTGHVDIDLYRFTDTIDCIPITLWSDLLVIGIFMFIPRVLWLQGIVDGFWGLMEHLMFSTETGGLQPDLPATVVLLNHPALILCLTLWYLLWRCGIRLFKSFGLEWLRNNFLSCNFWRLHGWVFLPRTKIFYHGALVPGSSIPLCISFLFDWPSGLLTFAFINDSSIKFMIAPSFWEPASQYGWPSI